MARKRTTSDGPAAPKPEVPSKPGGITPPEPQAAGTAASADTMVVDMPVRDLLQLLGRTLPEGAVVPARVAPDLPQGVDEEARVADLKLGELLQLLASFHGPSAGG